METKIIQGEGGVALHAVATGPEDAPSILFIHGWSQHHLVWKKQFDALSDRFRLVAFDLRGHGSSEKPVDEAAYTTSATWAGDVQAVIDGFALKNPVLVGWSMGGWITSDYLRRYGDADLGGVALVGTSAQTGSKLAPEIAVLRKPDVVAQGMYSDDVATKIAATITFIRACFATEPSPDDLANLVALNMFAPPQIRAWCRGRSEDFRPALQSVTKPALIMHGGQERVCVEPIFEAVKASMPDAEVALYPEAGHAPFWEVPDAFNRDLADFVARAQTRTLEDSPT